MVKDKKGQALVEYILIIALISVIAIALVNYLGGYLKDAITKSSCGIIGDQYVEGKKPGEGSCVDKTFEELEKPKKETNNKTTEDTNQTTDEENETNEEPGEITEETNEDPEETEEITE